MPSLSSSQDAAPTDERHMVLRQAVRAVSCLPGGAMIARRAARFAIQNLPLSTFWQYRVHNLIAPETAPSHPVNVRTNVPGGGTVRLQLRLDNPRDGLSPNWYYWGYDNYEISTTRFLNQLLPLKKCVFDVGANIGYYALLSAARLRGRGEVHAFEPHPEVFAALQCNARLNAFRHLYVTRAAVSDHNGSESLFFPADLSWTMASLVPGVHEQNACEPVDVLRLDTYCARHGVDDIDLLRIDVEGAEVQVLRGLGDLLETCQPDIICEVLPSFEAEMEEFLRGTPYRKFALTEQGPQEVERVQSDEKFRDYYLSCHPVRAALV